MQKKKARDLVSFLNKALIVITLLPLISAYTFTFNCPENVEVNEEFECIVNAENINKNYDIKFEINEGGTINQIYAAEKWQTGRNYYINAIKSSGEYSFKIKINKNFSGETMILFKVRENGKSTAIVNQNATINVDKIQEIEETKNTLVTTNTVTPQKINTGITNPSVNSTIVSNSGGLGLINIPTENIINLKNEVNNNNKSTSEVKIAWESKNEKLRRYSIYGFCIFLIFIIAAILWRK